MARDIYETYETGIDGPAIGNVEVTPSDTEDLDQISRTIYIGSAGNLRLTAKDGTTATYTNLPAGTFLTVRARRVFATGTTASGIVSMY